MRSLMLPLAWAAMGVCLAACSDVMDSRAKEEARTSRKLSPHEAEILERYKENSLNNADYLDTTPYAERPRHMTDSSAFGMGSGGSYSGSHNDPAPGNSLFFPGMVY